MKIPSPRPVLLIGLLLPSVSYGLTTMVVELPSVRTVDDGALGPVTLLGQTVPQGSPVTINICYDETVLDGNPFNDSTTPGSFQNAVVSVDFLFGAGSSASLVPSTSMITLGDNLNASPGVEDVMYFDITNAAGDWLLLNLKDPTATALSADTSLAPMPGASLGASVFFNLQDSTLMQGADYQDLPASVSFTAGHPVPIPEPSRASLLLLSVLAVSGVRRRR